MTENNAEATNPAEGANSPPPTPPKKKKSKFGCLLKGCLLILILGGGLIALAPTLISTDNFRAEIVSELEKRTGRTCSLGSVSLGWMSGVTLKKLVIQADSPSAKPTLSLDSVRVDTDIFSLLGEQITIKNILIEGANSRLIINADGTTNLASLFVAQKSTRLNSNLKKNTNETILLSISETNGAGNKPLNLRIDRVRILNSKIHYQDLRSKQQVTLGIKDLTLRLPDGLDKPIPVAGVLTLFAADGTTQTGQAEIKGSLDLLKNNTFDPQGTADLDVALKDLRLPELSRTLGETPDFALQSGTAAGALRLKFAAGLPSVTLTDLQIRNLKFTASSLTAPVTLPDQTLSLQAAYDLKTGVATIENSRLRSDLADLKLTGTIATAQNLAVKAKLTGEPLVIARLTKFLRAQKIAVDLPPGLTGTLTPDVTMQLSVDHKTQRTTLHVTSNLKEGTIQFVQAGTVVQVQPRGNLTLTSTDQVLKIQARLQQTTGTIAASGGLPTKFTLAADAEILQSGGDLIVAGNLKQVRITPPAGARQKITPLLLTGKLRYAGKEDILQLNQLRVISEDGKTLALTCNGTLTSLAQRDPARMGSTVRVDGSVDLAGLDSWLSLSPEGGAMRGRVALKNAAVKFKKGLLYVSNPQITAERIQLKNVSPGVRDLITQSPRVQIKYLLYDLGAAATGGKKARPPMFRLIGGRIGTKRLTLALAPPPQQTATPRTYAQRVRLDNATLNIGNVLYYPALGTVRVVKTELAATKIIGDLTTTDTAPDTPGTQRAYGTFSFKIPDLSLNSNTGRVKINKPITLASAPLQATLRGSYAPAAAKGEAFSLRYSLRATPDKARVLLAGLLPNLPVKILRAAHAKGLVEGDGGTIKFTQTVIESHLLLAGQAYELKLHHQGSVAFANGRLTTLTLAPKSLPMFMLKSQRGNRTYTIASGTVSAATQSGAAASPTYLLQSTLRADAAPLQLFLSRLETALPALKGAFNVLPPMQGQIKLASTTTLTPQRLSIRDATLNLTKIAIKQKAGLPLFTDPQTQLTFSLEYDRAKAQLLNLVFAARTAQGGVLISGKIAPELRALPGGNGAKELYFGAASQLSFTAANAAYLPRTFPALIAPNQQVRGRAAAAFKLSGWVSDLAFDGTINMQDFKIAAALTGPQAANRRPLELKSLAGILKGRANLSGRIIPNKNWLTLDNLTLTAQSRRGKTIGSLQVRGQLKEYRNLPKQVAIWFGKGSALTGRLDLDGAEFTAAVPPRFLALDPQLALGKLHQSGRLSGSTLYLPTANDPYRYMRGLEFQKGKFSLSSIEQGAIKIHAVQGDISLKKGVLALEQGRLNFTTDIFFGGMIDFNQPAPRVHAKLRARGVQLEKPFHNIAAFGTIDSSTLYLPKDQKDGEVDVTWTGFTANSMLRTLTAARPITFYLDRCTFTLDKTRSGTAAIAAGGKDATWIVKIIMDKIFAWKNNTKQIRYKSVSGKIKANQGTIEVVDAYIVGGNTADYLVRGRILPDGRLRKCRWYLVKYFDRLLDKDDFMRIPLLKGSVKERKKIARRIAARMEYLSQNMRVYIPIHGTIMNPDPDWAKFAKIILKEIVEVVAKQGLKKILPKGVPDGLSDKILDLIDGNKNKKVKIPTAPSGTQPPTHRKKKKKKKNDLDKVQDILDLFG